MLNGVYILRCPACGIHQQALVKAGDLTAECGHCRTHFGLNPHLPEPTPFVGCDLAEERPMLRPKSRCEVCGWPQAASAKDGCVPGNCSMRPRPLTLSPDDAVFLELRNKSVQEIARWFGIPPHLLGQEPEADTPAVVEEKS